MVKFHKTYKKIIKSDKMVKQRSLYLTYEYTYFIFVIS